MQEEESCLNVSPRSSDASYDWVVVTKAIALYFTGFMTIPSGRHIG